ncbi:MAG: DUF3617 domain-containing protein [Nevskiales bacterium]
MMMRMTIAVALAAGLASHVAVAAEESTMKPGQWEYTMTMEMAGMPVAMPPTTYTHCLTQADLDKGAQYEAGDQKECEMKNLKHSASGASYDMVCKNGSAGHYDFTVMDTSMQGKGSMTVQGQEMKTNFSAKRTGDCTK